MNNTKQCAYWTLTINEHASCFSNLQEILDNQLINNPNIEYSYIKHNADEDDKNLHYHLVIYFKGKVKRFTTIQNIFVGAHVEMTNAQRYKRSIQYLIHKNNPEKEQYKASDIVSNIETSLLDDILLGSGYDFELFQEEKLFDYMSEFMRSTQDVTMQQFILRFGLGAIQKYYFIIKDQIKDFKWLWLKVEKRTTNLDKMQLAFNIINNDIRQEFELYNSLYNDMTFEEYKLIAYKNFENDVQRGYIDIDEILRRNEVKIYE